MKKLLENDRMIVIVCLLQLVSVGVACIRDGAIIDSLGSIWLIIVIVVFTTIVNILNYKILKEFNSKSYKKFLKMPSWFFAVIIVYAMANWILKGDDAEFFIIQTVSTGVYIGLCVTRQYCVKKEGI